MKPSKANGSKKRGKRKRKPSSPSPPQFQTPPAAAAIELQAKVGIEDDEERRQILDIDWLMGAFSSASLDHIASAYTEAGRDPFKAAGILGTQLEDPGEAAAAAEEGVIIEEKKRQQQQQKKWVDEERKQKRVAASSGMVANVIGKGYAKRGSNCSSGREGKRELNEGYVNWNGKDRMYSVEEGEEFLCSMLGDNSELGMGVVKDVLCQCGCDVEQALDVLLDLSASSFNQFTESDGRTYLCTYPELSSMGLPKNNIYSFQSTDMASDSTYPSEKENGILQYVGYGCRDDMGSFVSTEEQPPPSSRAVNPALQQKVLESLFSIPDYPKHEPNHMNWKKVVQKVESFGRGLEYRNGVTEPLLNARNVREEDEYRVCRSAARKHWDTMRSYYQKAAVAYSRGERAHAAQLSETGRIHGSLARKADEKASREIFEARNKDIKNTITIDLHGQHVKQGIGLLKLHLLLFTYIPSVQFLKIITGCGGDGNGKGKLKRSVISLINREGIEWCQENSGTLLLKLDGLKEYNFTEEDENDSDEC